MKILAIGDIVGGIAIDYLTKNLSKFVKENGINFVIANAENASEIKGLSKNDADALYNLGVDFITLGNHAFGKKDIYSFLDNNDYQIIRPCNFPNKAPGSGYSIVNVDGYKILIINALGTMYMTPLNSPFESIDRILDREKGRYDFAILCCVFLSGTGIIIDLNISCVKFLALSSSSLVFNILKIVAYGGKLVVSLKLISLS